MSLTSNLHFDFSRSWLKQERVFYHDIVTLRSWLKTRDVAEFSEHSLECLK